MLVGRESECNRIDALLSAARGRRSGSLVVRGEAGIGKTALLDYAIERAGDFRVLTALGVESEAEFAFAGVEQLIRPVMDVLSELPPPQARALKAALAIEEGGAQEGLAVSLAILNVLAAAADNQPVLCVVDDAHWLDRASADALTFVARRLHADEVLMLFASREPVIAPLAAHGLASMTLHGLSRTEARALLAASAPDLAEPPAARLVELAHGNPLALLEISRVLEPEHRSGRAPLDEPLPVGAEIERAFLARARPLSREAQRALLLVAAGDPGDAETLSEALSAAMLDAEPVAEAEDAGLLRPGHLDFCHPLARSAIYRTARPRDRRAAHAALAAASVAPDRRAWHLAAAVVGTDDDVAAALEEAAAAARRRGGVAAEGRALERSALLTADRETRARRLLKAALATEAAGWIGQAEGLLAEVAKLTKDPELRARAIARRSYLLFGLAQFEQAYMLGFREAESAAPAEAALVLTGMSRVLTHRLRIPEALATAERAWALGASANPTFEATLDFRQNLAWTEILAGQIEQPLAVADGLRDRVDYVSVITVDLATIYIYLEEYGAARAMLEEVIEHTREADAPGVLYYALDQMAKVETRAGSLLRAYALELECLESTPPGDDVGLAACLAWLGLVEGMLGRTDAGARAAAALSIADGRGDDYNSVRARGALGLEALGRGDSATAANWLEPAVAMLAEGGVLNPNWFRIDADLVEALLRLGRPDDAARHLARFEQHAESTRGRWARAAAMRCRAFSSTDGDFAGTFETALALHADDPSMFERARTELCFGERLRRTGQRRAAREQLRSALATFERIGAEPWAERTRIELRATGEHIRRHDPSAAERLTPQELQVALVVAQGLSNRDVAARLFLSPKTVEFHLTRIYRKLEIRSRSELVRRIVELERGGVDPVSDVTPARSPRG
jgi:DNA-binding CsgD family transcriptional regulator